jgi:filamentous hemagglutinin
MNKHLHRIVFNAARGLRMVVQETARSTGRGARKATSGGAGAGSAAVSVAAIAAALMSAPLHAQIVADPHAPGGQRPTVLGAPNGVPVVNIQTPSAAGVSRNTYSQFDVQRNGVVLNNSRGNAQTQLGGWVQGNPWLATGSARVILNEVHSANPSQLRGYVEVAGPRTEVIIANPAGIQVDGGGFINVNRATLTTGTPQFNAQGGLDSFVVRGGSVSVDGAGLDAAKTDYAAILARAVQVNAGLWANELKVVTGANQVSADSSQATPTAGSGAAPSFALDVAALGGMYAGKITLVGTEAGVGVRNAGHIGAGAGGLVVTAAGRLENTGTLEGAKVELSSASDIDNRGGTIRQAGTRDISVTAPVLSNTQGGFIGAEPVAATPAGGGEATAGSGASGSTPEVTIGGGTAVATDSNAAATAGIAEVAPAQPATAVGSGAISAAGTILNDGGRIYAGGEMSLNTPRIDNSGGTIAVGSLAVSGPTFSNAGGTLNVAHAFSADVGTLNNAGGSLRAGSIAIATTGELNNQDGLLASDGDVALHVGGSLRNSHGRISAVAVLDTTTGGALDNTSGGLIANGALALMAGSIDNTLGTIQSAAGAASLAVAGRFLNDRGSLGAGTDLAVQAGSLANTGSLRAGNDGTVAVTHALSNVGSIHSARNTTITAGSLASGSAAVLGAGIRSDGSLGAEGNLRVTTARELVAGGTLLAAGQMTLQGTTTDLSGSSASASGIDLTATQGNVVTSGATVVAAGTLGVHANSQAAQTLVNQNGKLGAGHIAVDASNISNTQGGEIIQSGSGELRIALPGVLDNTSGKVAASGSVQINAARVDNSAGVMASVDGALAVDASGAVVNDGGRMTAAADLHVGAASLGNRSGVLAGRGMTITTRGGAFDNGHGTVNATGAADISTGALTNDAGLIRAVGDLRVDTGSAQLSNTQAAGHASGLGGIASTAGSLTLTSGLLRNDGGFIGSTGALVSNTGGVSNQSGEIAGGATIAWNSTAFDNTSGSFHGVGDVHLTTAGGTLTNTAGTITARDGGLRIEAGTLKNAAQGSVAAVIASGGDLDIAATQLQNTAQGATQALLWSGKDLHLDAGTVTNAGQIQSSASARVRASQIDSTGGTMTAIDELRLETTTFDNTTTLTAGSFAFVGQRFNNQAGAVLQTSGSMALDASDAVTNDGRLVAGETLSINTGDLVNRAEITATDLQVVAARTITNTAAGVLGADNSVRLRTGTLSNSGVINANARGNASLVRIDADTVNNLGTGAIYGDNIQINAGTLNNSPDAGSVTAPVIAARNHLAIGVATLNNLDGASLYSIGSIAIGGTVDVNGVVNGKAQSLNNISATIEAVERLDMAAETLLNERRDVQIVSTQVLDDTRTMLPPAWWHNGPQTGPNALTGNYNGQVAYYVDPTAILKDEVFITPDGYQIHRAEVQLSASDSAFFTAWGSLSGRVGNRSRYDISQDGVVVIYYTSRQDGQANPDQVAGAPGAFEGQAVTVTRWETDTLAYNSAYGHCTTNCVRLQTPLDYNDPINNFNRDTLRQHPTSGSGNEVKRIAHHTAVEEQLVAGAGAEALILSGGAMNIDIGSALTNRYGRISARGDLTIDGQGGNPETNSKVTNIGHTLTRTHSFTNTTVTGAGGTYDWTNADIVENVGSVGGSITSGGTLTITGKTLANTNAANAGPAAVGNVTFGGMSVLPGTPGYSFTLPTSSLYHLNGGSSGAPITASAGAGTPGASNGMATPVAVNGNRPLVETDPRFASYGTWRSSDYLLNNLGFDANNVLKRLGDGFYEQQLIRQQLLQLTGSGYLDGYTNDQDQYTALLNAGGVFAQQYSLTLGVGLSEAQMALLTSDIVWLVSETVTLPDGTRETVLVPRVYQAVRTGDLDSSGALLAGKNIRIDMSGDVVNSGSIDGKSVTQILAGGDLANLGGRVTGGQAVGLYADRDILNIGGQVKSGGVLVADAGRDLLVTTTVRSDAGGAQPGGVITQAATRIDRVASMEVTGQAEGSGQMSLSAGRNATLTGAQIVNGSAAGATTIKAGGDLTLATVIESRSESTYFNAGNNYSSASSKEVGTTIQGNGNVVLQSDGNTSIRGGNVQSKEGDLSVKAGGDITIEAARDTAQSDFIGTSTSKGLLRKKTTVESHALSTTTAIGSSLSGKTVTLSSGRDTVLSGSSLYAEDALRIDAKRDVRIEAAYDTATSTDFTQVTKTPSGIAKVLGSAGTVIGLTTLAPDPGSANLLTRKDAKDGASQTSTQVVSSTLSAGSIDIRSGRDTTVVGSTLVADNDVSIDAGRDLTVRSAQSTSTSTSNGSTQASGNVGSFWKPAIGRASSTTDGQSSDTVQVGSQIASLDGNVKLRAGGTYTQTASDVTALGTGADGKAGNIDISARNVVINEAYDTHTSAQQTEAKSLTAGGTASVPLYNAAQSTVGTARATSQTGDSRMQAIGAAATAYNAYKTYEAVTNPGYKVGAMLSDSRSQSSSTQSSSTVVGSTVFGAGNVNITATGGGTDSNLTATAATITGNNVSLSADNAVTLQSARSTSDYDYQQSSSKYGVGVSYSVGAQNGMTIDLAAGSNRGTGSGRDSTNVNTYVTAMNTATIKSGGNTTLDGAVVQAETVKAEVGGNLLIQSEQDTSTATVNQSGGGFDASICYFWCVGTPVVAGGSVNTAGGKGQYASVVEQSGIQAGDGGFDVKVAGNTNLVGGVIASTDKAVDGGKNSFTTGSLTMSDVVNVDTFNASGYSVSGSYGGTANGGAGFNGGSVGVGQAGATRTTTTTSGISGVAGNAEVRTGDGSNGLTPSWVASELLKDVSAQVQITSTATGILIEMTPQIMGAITRLMGGGSAPSLNQAELARNEIVGILKDPALTDQQRAQLNELLGFVKVGEEYLRGIQGQSGGADTVVGERLETTPARLLIPWGAAGSAGAAGAGAAGAGAAGLGSAAGSGYRDPETGQWVGASPINFPPLSAVEDLVRANPVLAPFYFGYLQFLGMLQSSQSSGNNDGQTAGGNPADTYGTPPNGASPPPDGDDDHRVANGADARNEVRRSAEPYGKSGQAFNVGTEAELEGLFSRLTQNSEQINASNYSGTMRVLPDGTRVGLREGSKTTGKTIDVFPRTGKPYKVHIKP